MLLGKTVGRQNEHQTGNALLRVSFSWEAIPVRLGRCTWGFVQAVPHAVNAIPCEQIQQVLQVVPLVVMLLLGLAPFASVFLRVPTGWNSARLLAVGELCESPEQAVMLIPSMWQLQSDAGGSLPAGQSFPASASQFPANARG